MLNTSILCSFSFDPKLFFAIIGFIFALLSFFYKNHETNQLRILKNITDNIKEINEICIDVFAKKEINDDTLPKISMYLDFLQLNIALFPTGKFYKCNLCLKEEKENVNIMIQDYKDLIFSDTPIENKSISIEDYDGSKERLDKIIQKSVDILKRLESYLP